MKDMQVIQHGFNLYGQEDVENLLILNGFRIA